jgi:hypothetical protein
MKPTDFIKKYANDNFHCIYRLISDLGVVVYVGRTSFPSNRIRSHMSSDREFSSIEFDAFDTMHDLQENEARQIVEYDPKYNSELPITDLFPKLKTAQDEVFLSLKGVVSDLPYVFWRTRAKHVSEGDLNKLKSDILNAAIQSLKEIHNARSRT